MTFHDNPLRKAAILIDSLDGPTADALLEQMGADQASRVRAAILQLGAVEPAERQRVIEAFMRAGTMAAVPVEDDGVEMDQSLVERINSSAAEQDSEPEEDEVPEHAPCPTAFAALHDVSTVALAECLSREHAQTIGVVLAHLPSRTSAQLLERLPAEQQADVLRCLAQLEETDPSVLDELEQQLLEQVGRYESLRESRKRGRAALAGILDATERESSRDLLGNLEPNQPWPVRQLDRTAPASSSPASSSPASSSPASSAPPLKPKPAATKLPTARPPKPRIAFTDLMALDDANLARLLRAANPEVALLALTGASRELVDRILTGMPPRQSRALRQRMAQLGPIRLSDMERAQQQLADLAMRMADDGLIELPSSRRFTIAA